MKTTPYIAFLFILLNCFPSAGQQNIYVNPTGSDGNDGTKNKPLATLQAAFDKAQKQFANEQVIILVEEGSYFMDRPLILSKAHSRTSKNAIVVQGDGKEKPVFYGGKKLPAFRPVSGGQWLTEIPEVRTYGWMFQQLYVNGERAIPAQSPNTGFFKPRYVTEVQLQKDSARINDFSAIKIGIPAAAAATLKGLSKIELSQIFANFYHNWTTTVKPVASFNDKDTSFIVTGLTMKPGNKISSKSLFRFTNVRKGVDSPGEWYLETSGRLYYKPRPGEKPENTFAVAPVMDKFIVIRGTDTDGGLVSNIRFQNLSFQATGFQITSIGLEPHQASSSIEAVVQVDYASNISFIDCEIAHTGTNAIWFRKACSNSEVKNCYMHDLGAGGVKIGETSISPKPAEITNSITVDNNIVQSGGQVFPAAVGVVIFNASDNKITHNDISDLRYSGVSVGWVWGYGNSPSKRNLVAYNHIHHIGWGELSDMGAVYTLGASEGTVVRNNIVHHIYSYDYGGWGLYADQGSSGITFENNLVYACKDAAFHQNYGKNNIVRNNIFALNLKGQLQATRAGLDNTLSFTNNIIYFNSGNLEQGNWDRIRKNADKNCYFDGRVKGPQLTTARAANLKAQVDEAHSIVADPGFVNPNAYDFRFKDVATAKKIGFQPFDYNEIGVVGSDEWKNKAKLPANTKSQFEEAVKRVEASK